MKSGEAPLLDFESQSKEFLHGLGANKNYENNHFQNK
jgi:hypothetical protein